MKMLWVWFSRLCVVAAVALCILAVKSYVSGDRLWIALMNNDVTVESASGSMTISWVHYYQFAARWGVQYAGEAGSGGDRFGYERVAAPTMTDRDLWFPHWFAIGMVLIVPAVRLIRHRGRRLAQKAGGFPVKAT